jgi:hypothetical protein
MLCHHCANEIKIEGMITRGNECTQCGSDIRCCLNCANYDVAAHNRCREPQAEWVSDREKANFCDFFRPNERAATGHTGTATTEDARRAFEDLFKNRG